MVDLPEATPTIPQLQTLYSKCKWLTNAAFHPIHIIRMDERTGNIFVLAGREESIEFEIYPNGGLTP
jgi:hypothetical protein